MGIIKNLLTRFWPTGALFLGGFLLIIYSSLGFVYWQQGAQQSGLEGQITKLSLILFKPLPSSEELRAEYDNVTSALAPKTDKEYIEELVGIAKKSGINVDAGKFSVPPASFGETNVGGGTYQLISFSGIHVQGDYNSVMAFIADLDSGKTLETKTMVLRGVTISQQEVIFTGEEGDRRAEFRNVTAAVLTMMKDNGLSAIPNPISYGGRIATNLTGDDPKTLVIEGFPDITTNITEKGYSGNATPRDGYVLYNHDKISTDNTTRFTTTNYTNTLTTNYYYTCEADGTVRQFDRAIVAMAAEYTASEASVMETVVAVDVNIYTKRRQ